jgi:uncharacterized protein YbaP (TraB family)
MKRLAIACAALLAAATGCARAQPPVPLLWQVSDGDNSIYLLGSFHALEATDYPLAPSVDAAFADAEKLRFELDPAEMNSPELGMQMVAAGRLPEGRTLQSQVGAGTWAKLEAYTKSSGVPMAMFTQMEPWFVALVISVTEMQRMGLNPDQGLDHHMITLAATAGKPTAGLETAAEQFAAFDSMTREEQEQALLETLDEAADFQTQMRSLHALWRNGDAAGLYDRMGADLREKYPRLYRRINVERNDKWVPKLRVLLDGEKRDDTLVVVGALHLLGGDGVVEKLRKAGYKVERL